MGGFTFGKSHIFRNHFALLYYEICQHISRSLIIIYRINLKIIFFTYMFLLVLNYFFYIDLLLKSVYYLLFSIVLTAITNPRYAKSNTRTARMNNVAYEPACGSNFCSIMRESGNNLSFFVQVTFILCRILFWYVYSIRGDSHIMRTLPRTKWKFYVWNFAARNIFPVEENIIDATCRNFFDPIWTYINDEWIFIRKINSRVVILYTFFKSDLENFIVEIAP